MIAFFQMKDDYLIKGALCAHKSQRMNSNPYTPNYTSHPYTPINKFTPES